MSITDEKGLSMKFTGIDYTSSNRNYYFPCCPTEKNTYLLENYFKRLKVGLVFAYNEDSPKLIISKFIKTRDNSSVLVMCEREGLTCEIEGFKPWVLYEIKCNTDSYSHVNIGSYFEKTDAENAFITKQEVESTY